MAESKQPLYCVRTRQSAPAAPQSAAPTPRAPPHLLLHSTAHVDVAAIVYFWPGQGTDSQAAAAAHPDQTD